MIKKLIMALGISVCFSFGLGITEDCFECKLSIFEYAGTIWVFEGLGALVFTVLLFSSLFILKPSEKSRLLAYEGELVDENYTHEGDGKQIKMHESDAREVRKDAEYMSKGDQQDKNIDKMDMELREEKKYQ